MLTGELRSQVDAIWNAFWTGGISNPMEVIEQITYLLFIRRLDDAHTLEEGKALALKRPMENRVFPPGQDAKGRDFDDLLFLGPDGGSMKLVVGAELVQVISCKAPLGCAMLGKCEGDTVSIPAAPIRQQFEVLRVH